MFPPHFLPAYTYTKESLILLHRLSTGLNVEHMPDISARKVVTDHWTVLVIQEVGMSSISNGSRYKPSEEGKASRASCKQDFAWLAKEKKWSNEHSHLGSHPQNDPLSRWTYCSLGQVSPVQCHFENTDYAFPVLSLQDFAAQLSTFTVVQSPSSCFTKWKMESILDHS